MPENVQLITEILANWMQLRLAELYTPEQLEGVDIRVERTTQEGFGDYQSNVAMKLAKPLRCAPRQIAEAIVADAVLAEGLDKIEIAGPGFINLYLEDAWLSDRLAVAAADPRLAVPAPGAGKRVVIDYSSPNVAKPMHVGHIRSTVIGNALDRLHRFAGYDVIADNHVGDWGTQFGKLILGYRNFLDEEALAQSPVEELERIYVASHNKSAEDPAWLDAVRAELVKLQQGDEENRALWQRFIDLSLEEFDKIYSRLGVQFDLHRGESFYNDLLADTVDQLLSKGLAEESEGALVVNLEDEKNGVCIVRKSDGGFNYATSDLATVRSRVEEFRPESIIYVTDERQQLHFRQFFSVCRRAGWDANLVHVWFGLMRLPEGTFSTREGNVIKLEVMLDEAERRALEMVQASSPEMDAEVQKEVARAVGLGAIKYADLSQNPQSLVTFTWDKALALDGNSAPYLQYAHARIRSVLDKFAAAHPEADLDAHSIQLDEPIERRLALRLLQFPESVLSAQRNYRPNYLADYLYELAQLYSSFYQNVPFLKAEEGVRESRLRICRQVAATLQKGLDLLGIDAPERI